MDRSRRRGERDHVIELEKTKLRPSWKDEVD